MTVTGAQWIFLTIGASSHSKNQVPGKTVGPFSKDSPGGGATGQTLRGEGWYRVLAMKFMKGLLAEVWKSQPT